MKIKPGELKLYAVTDRAWTDGMDGVLSQVEAAIKGGATFVQVREKHLDAREFFVARYDPEPLRLQIFGGELLAYVPLCPAVHQTNFLMNVLRWMGVAPRVRRAAMCSAVP